jgi:hypothetical protein
MSDAGASSDATVSQPLVGPNGVGSSRRIIRQPEVRVDPEPQAVSVDQQGETDAGSDARVTRAATLVDSVPGRPLAELPDVYERVQTELSDALASVEDA